MGQYWNYCKYLNLYLDTLGQIEFETFQLLKLAKFLKVPYKALISSCILPYHFQWFLLLLVMTFDFFLRAP